MTPRRSWERVRPYGLTPLASPMPTPGPPPRPPLRPILRPDRPEIGRRPSIGRRPNVQRPVVQTPLSPASPYMPGGYDYGFPPAPEVPGSPTWTTVTGSTESASGSSSAADHWVPIVFGQSRPTTNFRATGTESACYGENMPRASTKLGPDYDELLRLYVKPLIFP
jgi:hypothetical protein